MELSKFTITLGNGNTFPVLSTDLYSAIASATSIDKMFKAVVSVDGTLEGLYQPVYLVDYMSKTDFN